MPSGPSCSGMVPVMAGTGGAGTVRPLRPGRLEGSVPAGLDPGLAPVLGLAVPGPNQVALAPGRAAGLPASTAPEAPTGLEAALAAAPGEAASPAAPEDSAVPGPAGEAPDSVEVPAAEVSEAPEAGALAVPVAGASGAAELAAGNKQKPCRPSRAVGLSFCDGRPKDG